MDAADKVNKEWGERLERAGMVRKKVDAYYFWEVKRENLFVENPHTKEVEPFHPVHDSMYDFVLDPERCYPPPEFD